MNKITLLIICGFLQIVTAQNSQVLLKTDFEGTITQGSIEALIEKIQDGATVRMGWQLDFDGDNVADLEHWAPAEFITIMNGHVYNQVKTIHQQMPLPENVSLGSNGNTWQAIISTKGIMQHQYGFKERPQIGGMNGEELSKEQQKEIVDNLLKMQEDKVATIWAITS